MTLDRRSLLSASLGAGVGAGLLSIPVAHAAAAAPQPAKSPVDRTGIARAAGTALDALQPNSGGDQTAVLQRLIDDAAARGTELVLPPGRFRSGRLTLRPGTRVSGCGAATILEAAAGPTLLNSDAAHDIVVTDLTLDGGHIPAGAGASAGLVSLKSSRNILLANLEIRSAGAHAILLDGCGGRVTHCRVADAADAGIHANDSTGLTVAMNEITDCGNNGIQVWRSRPGEDGTQVIANHIARIAAHGGGNGQNGNGINVYRADGVSVTDNRITDCAYSAIRGNAASNIQIVSNSCQRLGEVAIYAEFGFAGAVIAANIVDVAATGIAVTNFDVGGRLAVIQGNLIRNLVRREHEPADKRGEGIAVEADATITGNTIEGAPTAGIVIGWAKYMRDCVASGNLIRNSRIGIMVSSDTGAGAAFVTSNMISGATDGAIRAMTRGTAHGPDLALTTTETPRIRIIANMAV
ncbi:MAG: TIGR03808 family TAT-translocated repetitive protein [Hyphomicrobium sp.]